MSLKVEHHIWNALSFLASDPLRLLAEETEVDDTGHVTDIPVDGAEHGMGSESHGAESHGGDDGEHHSEFGVHITFEDLYASIIFFTVIYLMGAFAQRVLRMPSLVGEIFAGIILGPPVADWVPNPVAFVMLGEIG